MDSVRGNDPARTSLSPYTEALGQGPVTGSPITFRFEPAGFGEGNAQPTLWKRWRRLTTLATTMNWDFCCVIHSVLQTMTSCLISRGGIFENDEEKYDCQSRKKTAPTNMIGK